jgi:hypothetical protein
MSELRLPKGRSMESHIQALDDRPQEAGIRVSGPGRFGGMTVKVIDDPAAGMSCSALIGRITRLAKEFKLDSDQIMRLRQFYTEYGDATVNVKIYKDGFIYAVSPEEKLPAAPTGKQ